MFLKISDHHSLMSPDAAEKLAAELNADDDDFSYVAVHDPKGKGRSFIRILDEDGEVMGNL